ncbi:molybdenum cofactor guanylyltransferase [Saccharibacillus kuerlensis]|uniref:Probable molybdenum cofactor guanylyltransferase n=1 Tax=Saccharibacillus kuerlensis TaxID=459527 RepID=A0ABQ2L3Z2_9BACL|nr:molybdenum cofactor guanylyltransferase [Saccharibacillus kuerlensis]GGO02014.1 putative molybdenum cofactor guanylyltransferase [Saccharibacillus kuerlensis]
MNKQERQGQQTESDSAVHSGQRTVGILLAGGLSRRYGSPKAFAEYEGRPFHVHAYEALAGTCDTVIVSSSQELAGRFPQTYDVCTDLPDIMGQGPLAGICTVMQQVPADRYVVLPCDMPRIGPNQSRRLAQIAQMHEEADVTAVRTADAHLPLLSVWHSNLSERLEERVRSGNLAVMKLLAEVNTVWVNASMLHDDPRIFHNFNTPDAD